MIPFIFNSNNKASFLDKYGKNSYVLITGSSEGIGLSYAEQFAKLGFNIILTGRKEDKLLKVKNDILSQNKKIDIKYIVVDFSNFDNLDNFKSFMKKLDGIDISVLINNVGFFNRNNYEKIDYKELIDCANTNCLTMTLLLKEFINKFKNRVKKSAIINLSSITSTENLAFCSIYSPCKLFNSYISESLSKLGLSDKIDILAEKPGFVDTNMPRSNFKNNYKFLKNTASTTTDLTDASLINLGVHRVSNGSKNHIFSKLVFDALNCYFGLFMLIKPIKKFLSKHLN